MMSESVPVIDVAVLRMMGNGQYGLFDFLILTEITGERRLCLYERGLAKYRKHAAEMTEEPKIMHITIIW